MKPPCSDSSFCTIPLATHCGTLEHIITGINLTSNKRSPFKLCQAKTPKWQNGNLKRSSASAFFFRFIGALPKDALRVLYCACFWKKTLFTSIKCQNTMIAAFFSSLNQIEMLPRANSWNRHKTFGSFILVKSDLLTFDFLMSIMGLHGFSPAPWIAGINAFNEALIHGKVGLCPSVKISFNSFGEFTMELLLTLIKWSSPHNKRT